MESGRPDAGRPRRNWARRGARGPGRSSADHRPPPVFLVCLPPVFVVCPVLLISEPRRNGPRWLVSPIDRAAELADGRCWRRAPFGAGRPCRGVAWTRRRPDGLSAGDGTRATAVAGALGGRGLRPLVRVACPQTGGEGIRVSYWNPASAGVSLFAKNGLGSFCLPADWGWDV